MAAFDRLGNTILTIAAVRSGIPREYLHRTIDDVPVVTPAVSECGSKFYHEYKALCADTNIRLAEPCPRKEKAFEDSTVGTVLGVRFNTTNLIWTLHSRKIDKILRAISKPLLNEFMSLEEMQILMGLLNDFCQMCPFLHAFRLPLNTFISVLT